MYQCPRAAFSGQMEYSYRIFAKTLDCRSAVRGGIASKKALGGFDATLCAVRANHSDRGTIGTTSPLQRANSESAVNRISIP